MRISRWHSRFRSPHPLPAAEIARWHDGLERLDEGALVDGLGDDEWLLIDYLPLALSWRIGEVDPVPGVEAALRVALRQARDDRARAVRYANLREAWADCLYRAALGDVSRVWAWARMGLVPEHLARGAAPAAVLDAAATGLATTFEAWPVLQRLLAAEAQRAAFSALVRALPAPAWQLLLRAMPQTAPYCEPVQVLPEPPASWPGAAAGDRAGLTALLTWIERQPWLATRHAGVVAPLLASLSWPEGTAGQAATRAAEALAYCRAAAAAVRPSVRTRPDAGPPATPPRAADGAVATGPSVGDPHEGAGAAFRASRPTAPVDTAPLPPLPEPVEYLATVCAGVLFWLPRVAASEVPAWLAAESDLVADFVTALLDALEVPPEDGLRRALLGATEPLAPAPPVRERAEGLCAAWEAWLAEAAPELPERRLAWVCRRAGRLLVEPGWIELVLPLDSVDTSVRRLGLDLDPGWLPWLGRVVKIRYE